ncbi:class I SAM-dependent DNA methyltransferase [Micromonospora sp. NPDC050397]|uniref:class I SAM-dependent DNA methyltransferase n=1 Tax=Micromonospora sp. NPDC050397 TaxID=3364279 RepID=UPI00384F4313
MDEPTFLTDTRAGYNTIAIPYDEMFGAETDTKPLTRAMFNAFAEIVAENGPVIEVGSGPGRVTAYLDGLGLDIRGIDLSPEMVALARRNFPKLRFEEGTMTALDLADGTLAGLVAWYSIIHVPPALLPEVFAEFRRVLAPGGHLLLGFQVGDEAMHRTEAFGLTFSLVFQRLMPERIEELLAEAGFVVDARLVRQPDEGEKVAQAHLLAHKPA